MRFLMLSITSLVVASGCASGGADVVRIPGRSGDVVVVNDGDREDREGRRIGRALNVPKGHYPPPGECRLWFPRRPPGQQPPPAKCERLIGRVPFGAFILYNDKAWDTEYDWRKHVRQNRGAVPDIILRIVESIDRN